MYKKMQFKSYKVIVGLVYSLFTVSFVLVPAIIAVVIVSL